MTSSNSELRQLERSLSTLLNKQLQSFCANYRLKTSGVKAELQGRIRAALAESFSNDPVVFQRMRATIQNLVRNASGLPPQPNMPGPSSNGGNQSYGGYAAGKSTNYSTPPAYQFTGADYTPPPPTPTLSAPGTSSAASAGTLSYYKNTYQASRDLQFKPSPFYSFVSRIGDIRTCEAMNQHRNTIHLSIRVNEHPNLANLANSKSYRLLLFCAADNTGIQDIAFPHQSEFKVNGGEIKANLRGLKGKPGTTRPVDVTDSLRTKQANYNNNIEFTYALTNKVKKHDLSPAETKFYLAAYLCRMVSVDELVTKVRGRKIAKATVIQEMTKKANDPDVVATSTVLSLKCPLSYTRLVTPCRSTLCNHIQCFDASSYLLLQEQGPQWICPICNQSAPFENLAVDQYARDILDRTRDSVEQVTIEPDGEWSTQPKDSLPKRPRDSSVNRNFDIDDDVSVITDNLSYSNGGYGDTPHIIGTPNRSLAGGGTPCTGSREPSGAPRSGAKKRPAAEVIDLTLSSDEDDTPLTRPVKRQNIGSGRGMPICSYPLPSGPSY